MDRKTPVKVAEAVIRCPVCGRNTLKIEDYMYEIPRLGKIIMSVGKCGSCGYKFRDVRLAEAGKPRKIVFRVEKPEDLNVLVVRASSASIVIPELGLTMIPGPASEGFITTVEGVLDRFLEAVEAACISPDADKEACRKAREAIERAKRGEQKFTLVIVDPEGVSAVDSPRAVAEEASKKELEELGYIIAEGT